MQKYTSPQAKCEQFSLGNTISVIRKSHLRKRHFLMTFLVIVLSSNFILAQWKFSGDKHKFLQVCTERIFHQLYPLVLL